MWVIFSKSFDTFLFTFGWWRNFGTILFVQQNSWQFWKVEAFWICFICTQNSIHFLMLEEFWIYFICTNQYWGPIFQTINLFYLYWHFQSQLIILGILWEFFRNCHWLFTFTKVYYLCFHGRMKSRKHENMLSRFPTYIILLILEYKV